MKKLLAILGIFICTPVWANTISLTSISPDSSSTVHNSNFSTLSTWANGNIEGSTDGGSTVNNIKADSVYEINMANDANPRVRDSELLSVTVDTISGGAAATQGSYVYSGCAPATDSDLTSDVSACVAYVNGYRVTKSATAQTYGNNTTTYLWLTDTGTYTQSTNPNTNISNAALLASVVTSGGAITTVNDLANRRLPGLVVPANYRRGMHVRFGSATTIVVDPGTVEINNTMVTKTSATTLTVSSAGDYAGGSSLQATNTTIFVGIDASGNLKLHTTAPTHYNYAVSNTATPKRYATWSGTVYRIIGWARLNATSGGQCDTWGVSNIADGTVTNTVYRATADVTVTSVALPVDNTSPAITEGKEFQTLGIYPSNPNNYLKIETCSMLSPDTGERFGVTIISKDSGIVLGATAGYQASGEVLPVDFSVNTKTGGSSFMTYALRAGRTSASQLTFNGQAGVGLFNGFGVSYIRITELENQGT